MTGPTLVTGAAGFAGGHLLDLLADGDGVDAVGWHRPGGRPPMRSIAGARWEGVDLLDAAQVRERCDGCAAALCRLPLCRRGPRRSFVAR